MVQLYLDCDGVLANFDRHASGILGELAKSFQQKYGDDVMWEQIQNHSPNFWTELELLDDAFDLIQATKHVYPKPIILTGIPQQMPTSTAQKREWVTKHFGEDQNVICCLVEDKPTYCNRGDILVDDRLISKEAWEKQGGIFIHHTSARESLRELRRIGVLNDYKHDHN